MCPTKMPSHHRPDLLAKAGGAGHRWPTLSASSEGRAPRFLGRAATRRETCPCVGLALTQHGGVNRVCQEERLGAATNPLFYTRWVERAVDRVDERRLAGDERRRHRGTTPVGVLADWEGAPDPLAGRRDAHPLPVVGEIGLPPVHTYRGHRHKSLRGAVCGGRVIFLGAVRIARGGGDQNAVLSGVPDDPLQHIFWRPTLSA